MSGDKETLGVYDAQAAEYARVTADAVNDPLLAAFLAAIPAGGRILDLGCGPGLISAHMAEKGFAVDATDASGEMIAMVPKRTGLTAWKATFEEIEGDAIYDGIWANFSLLHAARSDMPRHLAALRRALKSGGRFHIGLKSGSGEKRDRLGRLYTYYTENELAGLVTAAGFHVTDRATGCDKGLDGSMADWIALGADG